jgi:hypothetical protein
MYLSGLDKHLITKLDFITRIFSQEKIYSTCIVCLLCDKFELSYIFLIKTKS